MERIAQLEKANVEEKKWTMVGEVRRPAKTLRQLRGSLLLPIIALDRPVLFQELLFSGLCFIMVMLRKLSCESCLRPALASIFICCPQFECMPLLEPW